MIDRKLKEAQKSTDKHNKPNTHHLNTTPAIEFLSLHILNTNKQN